MQPAFRSGWSAGAFCLLLAVLLCLPLILPWAGLAPRVETYKSMTTRGGNDVGQVLRTLDPASGPGDVVFLGSSLVAAGIQPAMVQSALSAHLQRTANVGVLALNWPGLDLEYFMLRDYLSQHRLRLLIWNPPQPHARAYDAPHVQAYRWVRWGEYSDALSGLPLQYRVALYGEMVIGAPRQLLSRLRTNLFGQEQYEGAAGLARAGYYGAPFVPDSLEARGQDARRFLIPLSSPMLETVGPEPGPYQLHFALKILELAAQHGCTVVLIHVPLDVEEGSARIPELAAWSQLLGAHDMVAISSAELFKGIPRQRVRNFYRDLHFNENGTTAFTTAITPAIIEAYDRAAAQ